MSLMKNKPYVHIYTRSSGVTGSCMLVSVHFSNKKNVRFLLDCGSFQGLEEKAFLNEVIPFNTHKIRFALITHTHIDHTGLLPLLVKQGFSNNIYMTIPTYNIIDIPLKDACRINNMDSFTSTYTVKDLEKAFSLMVGVPFKKTFKPCKDISVTFYKNGHIVGAAIVEVIINDPTGEDIRLLFTGDYNNKNIFLNLEPLPISSKEKPYSCVICESTYGDIDSTDPIFTPCIVRNLSRALNDGLNVVSPSFGIGRTQEVLYLAKCAQKRKLLPKDTQFYLVGGTAQEATRRFQYSNLDIKNDMRRFLPYNFHILKGKQTFSKIQTIFDSPHPSVIIGPSGMADAGGIKNVTEQAIPRNDIFIQLTGYCSPISKGYELLNTPNGDTMLYGGIPVKKGCQVSISKEISSHAKRDDLVRFLSKELTAKSILVTHGEPNTRMNFSEYLLARKVTSQVGILNPDYAFEIDANGIRETFPTKFQLVF